MESGELSALFDARRYRDLAGELGRPEPGEELARARLRARLASVRWASLVDVVAAAESLAEAAADDAPLFTARAVRALARAGATDRARTTLAAAQRRWPDDALIALAAEQLETGEHRADSVEEHAVRLLVARGQITAARGRLEEMVKDGAHRGWALPIVADLARGERAWTVAAEAFEGIVQDGPEAFDVPLLETCAAFCRWSAGQVPRSLETLRRVHEETRGARGERGTARVWCSDVLDRLDRDPETRDAGPRWTFARSLVPLAARPGDLGASVAAVCLDRWETPAESIEACPTMASLRHALAARGLGSWRVVATPGIVESALGEGALVVVEEERSTRTSFLVVLGIEPTAGLLLLHDPERGGGYLTTLDEHRSRAALFGGSGLIVYGPEASSSELRERMLARGVAHDPRMDAVDACDLDEQGRVPGRARVDALAQKAIEIAPELPAGHRRQGEAMLEQLRAGKLAGGRLERWVAVTRERFPHAEWALQIYAQALEIWGRPHEAGIAWADAQRLDGWDERNTYGRACAHLSVGDPERAEALIRRTLSLRIDHAPAMARLATLLLDRGERARARLSSELAEEIAPTDPDVLHTRATLLERDDRFDDAIERLERIAVTRPRDTRARARVLRRLFHVGRWAEAREAASELVGIDPADAYNWADLAFVHYATGDGAAAADVLLRGVGRCGAARPLVEEASRVTSMLLGADERAAFLDALDPLVDRSPSALMDIAVQLTRRRLDEDGVALALRARERMVGDANGPWRAAQALLAVPAEREERFERIEGLLRETVQRTGGYPHPRVALALHTFHRDPDAALQWLHGADVSGGPVPVWKALSFIHASLGRAEELDQVEARLREVGPDALIDGGTFLRNVGLPKLALELFEAARERAAEHPLALAQAARTWLREGQPERAAALIERSSDAHVFLRTEIAVANADWQGVVRIAGPEVVRVTRRSGGDVYDGWVMRAQLAGAERALGDGARVEQLLADAGHHPEALAALADIGRRSGAEEAQADAERLAELAPGAWLTFERGGPRW